MTWLSSNPDLVLSGVLVVLIAAAATRGASGSRAVPSRRSGTRSFSQSTDPAQHGTAGVGEAEGRFR